MAEKESIIVIVPSEKSGKAVLALLQDAGFVPTVLTLKGYPTIANLLEVELGPSPIEIGATLKTLRRKKGLTLRQLQAQTGINYTYLCKIEKGKVRPPRRPKLDLIAQALGISPKALARTISQVAKLAGPTTG